MAANFMLLGAQKAKESDPFQSFEVYDFVVKTWIDPRIIMKFGRSKLRIAISPNGTKLFVVRGAADGELHQGLKSVEVCRLAKKSQPSSHRHSVSAVEI